MRRDSKLFLTLKHGVVIIALYGVIIGFNYVWDPDNIGWVDNKLHPYGIVVLFSALHAGRLMGVFAGLLGSALLIYFRIRIEGAPEYFEDYLTWSILDVPVILTGLGFFLGDIRVQLQNRIEVLTKDRDNLLDKRKNLLDQIEQLEGANLTLRERAYGQLSSASLLYRTARRLETDEEVEVYPAVLELIMDHLKVTKCCYYKVQGDELVLQATEGWEGEPPSKDQGRETVIRMAHDDERLVSLREKMAWTTGHFRQGTDILLAIPVIPRQFGYRGVITIEEIPFLQLTEATEQTLLMTADWAAIALDRVNSFMMLRRQAIYDEELEVYSEEHFHSSLAREFQRGVRLKHSFLLFLVKIKNFDSYSDHRQMFIWKAVGQILSRSLRGTDLVSRHAVPGYLWIMCTGPGMTIEFMESKLRESVLSLFESGSETKESQVDIVLTSLEAPGDFKTTEDVLEHMQKSMVADIMENIDLESEL